MKKIPLALLIFIYLFLLCGCTKSDNINNYLPGSYEESDIEVEEDKEENIEYNDQNLSINKDIIYNKVKNFSYKKIKPTYGYESLSFDSEIKIYKSMQSNIFKISKKSDSAGNYFIEPIELRGVVADANIIKKALKAFQYDNPEIFWISNSISFIKRNNSTIIKFKSVISPEMCEKIIKNLNSEISSIIGNIPRGLSEYQRELYIHDLIIKRCKYSKNISSNQAWRKFTIVGTFLDGEAVCEGFSKAAQVLLNNVGIESRLVTGSKQDEPHMWNIVKVNGLWYHLDVTWDSVDSMSRYNYFNLDDNAIKFDHTVYKEYSSSLKSDRYNFVLPKCLSLSDNYIYKNSIKINSIDKTTDTYMMDEIAKIINKKSKYMYIIISPKLNYSSTIRQMFTQKPYKFFYYLTQLEKNGKIKNKVDKQKIYYTENKHMNAVNIEINYV